MEVLRGRQARAPQNFVKRCRKVAGKVAGKVVGGILTCLPGVGSRRDFLDEQRPVQQQEAEFLLPERLPTLAERLQKAEAIARRLVVTFVLQTALTKAAQAEQKAAQQRAQQLQHQLDSQSVVQAESSLQQQQQQLQMQDDRHFDALTHASELHQQQLQAQNERQPWLT